MGLLAGRYPPMPYAGTTSQAASAAATVGSGTALAGAVSDVILAVTECQVAPGETARFPFAARTAYGVPSIHEFTVVSDNPDFKPEWARIGRSAGDSYGPPYILEISPGDIGSAQYGAYPLLLLWRAAGTYRHAGGRCTLVIGPAVRAVTEPAVTIWPTGQVCLLLENRGNTGTDGCQSRSGAAARTGRRSGSSTCRRPTARSVFPGGSGGRRASAAETSSLPSARQACP